MKAPLILLIRYVNIDLVNNWLQSNTHNNQSKRHSALRPALGIILHGATSSTVTLSHELNNAPPR